MNHSKAPAPTIDQDSARMARADLLAAIFFIGFALGVFYLSWTMPRLENRGVPLVSVPGIVPGMLSLGLLLCAVLLLLRSLRRPAEGGWTALGALLISRQAARVTATGALALIYTLVLVGRMPFSLATAIFVFCFIMLFEAGLSETPRRLHSSLAWAAGIAVVTAVAVVLVFERLFLVRLP